MCIRDSATPTEQVGVRDARADDCALQRTRRRLLADQVGEGLRAILAVEALVLRHIQESIFAAPSLRLSPLFSQRLLSGSLPSFRNALSQALSLPGARG